jgi:hypothetical protein
MFIAHWYGTHFRVGTAQETVVATFFGFAVYLVLDVGRRIFEPFSRGRSKHFVPMLNVDLST